MKKVLSILTALTLAGVMTVSSFAITLPVDPTEIGNAESAAYMPEDGSDFLVSEDLATEETTKVIMDGDKSTTASLLVGDSIVVNLGELLNINFMELTEVGYNLRGYDLEAWNGEEWVRIYNNDLVGGYYGATFDTIKTSAFKLTVTRLYNTTAAAIAELNFDYQKPIESDHEWINMGYYTSQMYFHHWNPEVADGKGRELLTRFTDITMIELFRFNDEGEFYLEIRNRNSNDTTLAEIDALDGEADVATAWAQTKDKDGNYVNTENGYEHIEANEEVEKWIQYVRDGAGTGDENPARLWFSLMFSRDSGQNKNTQVFLDDEKCNEFVEKIVTFCQRHGFSGVDIDWEYPTTAAGWASFNNLIAKLSAALHENGLMLSSAQSPGSGLSDTSLQSLDYLNIMAYDQIFADYMESGNHSTYRAGVNFIDSFLSRGVKAEDIVLGTAWYADKVTYGEQRGWKDIYEDLMMEIEDDEMVDMGQNIIYGKWGFNGPYLMADKVAYAVRRGIGGVFCWSLKNDINDRNSPYSLSYQTEKSLRRFAVGYTNYAIEHGE